MNFTTPILIGLEVFQMDFLRKIEEEQRRRNSPDPHVRAAQQARDDQVQRERDALFAQNARERRESDAQCKRMLQAQREKAAQQLYLTQEQRKRNIMAEQRARNLARIKEIVGISYKLTHDGDDAGCWHFVDSRYIADDAKYTDPRGEFEPTTVVIVDVSGSTGGFIDYHRMVRQLLAQYDSSTTRVVFFSDHASDYSIRVAINGTILSSVVTYLPQLIENLVLITDGEIHDREVRKCIDMLHTVRAVNSHLYVRNMRPNDARIMSVLAPLIGISRVSNININGKLTRCECMSVDEIVGILTTVDTYEAWLEVLNRIDYPIKNMSMGTSCDMRPIEHAVRMAAARIKRMIIQHYGLPATDVAGINAAWTARISQFAAIQANCDALYKLCRNRGIISGAAYNAAIASTSASSVSVDAITDVEGVVGECNVELDISNLVRVLLMPPPDTDDLASKLSMNGVLYGEIWIPGDNVLPNVSAGVWAKTVANARNGAQSVPNPTFDASKSGVSGACAVTECAVTTRCPNTGTPGVVAISLGANLSSVSVTNQVIRGALWEGRSVGDPTAVLIGMHWAATRSLATHPSDIVSEFADELYAHIAFRLQNVNTSISLSGLAHMPQYRVPYGTALQYIMSYLPTVRAMDKFQFAANTYWVQQTYNMPITQLECKAAECADIIYTLRMFYQCIDRFGPKAVLMLSNAVSVECARMPVYFIIAGKPPRVTNDDAVNAIVGLTNDMRRMLFGTFSNRNVRGYSPDSIPIVYARDLPTCVGDVRQCSLIFPEIHPQTLFPRIMDGANSRDDNDRMLANIGVLGVGKRVSLYREFQRAYCSLNRMPTLTEYAERISNEYMPIQEATVGDLQVVYDMYAAVIEKMQYTPSDVVRIINDNVRFADRLATERSVAN